MITVIVIPVRKQEPLSPVTLHDDRLAALQELLGGPIEALDLLHPPASFFVNAKGKLHGMAVNARATALLWAHNEALRGRDMIIGPAVLHGPVGPDGESTSAPSELVELLLGTGSFRVELASDPDGPFTPAAPPYKHWLKAYMHGLSLISLNDLIGEPGTARHMRVVVTGAPKPSGD